MREYEGINRITSSRGVLSRMSASLIGRTSRHHGASYQRAVFDLGENPYGDYLNFGGVTSALTMIIEIVETGHELFNRHR